MSKSAILSRDTAPLGSKRAVLHQAYAAETFSAVFNDPVAEVEMMLALLIDILRIGNDAIVPRRAREACKLIFEF